MIAENSTSYMDAPSPLAKNLRMETIMQTLNVGEGSLPSTMPTSEDEAGFPDDLRSILTFAGDEATILLLLLLLLLLLGSSDIILFSKIVTLFFTAEPDD